MIGNSFVARTFGPNIGVGFESMFEHHDCNSKDSRHFHVKCIFINQGFIYLTNVWKIWGISADELNGYHALSPMQCTPNEFCKYNAYAFLDT